MVAAGVPADPRQVTLLRPESPVWSRWRRQGWPTASRRQRLGSDVQPCPCEESASIAHFAPSLPQAWAPGLGPRLSWVNGALVPAGQLEREAKKVAAPGTVSRKASRPR